MKTRKRARKVDIGGGVRVDAYQVIMRALEEGVALGANRWARKGSCPEGVTREHLDSLIDHVERAVSETLCEVLRFDESNGDT